MFMCVYPRFFLFLPLFCLTVHHKNSHDVCDKLVFGFTLSKNMIVVMSFPFFVLNVASLFFFPFNHDRCHKFILSSI